jgi:hypothetical protein
MALLTSYARSGDVQIAYQVIGEGQLDVVVVPSFFSNIELHWRWLPLRGGPTGPSSRR